MHNEALNVAAMCLNNPDRSPVGINRRDTAPTPTGFAEIVSDNAFLHLSRNAGPDFPKYWCEQRKENGNSMKNQDRRVRKSSKKKPRQPTNNETGHAYVEMRSLPKKVAERCLDWYKHFKFWRRAYFTIGTAGAIVSALAATQLAQHVPYGAYLGVLASICFAVLGFTHPERNYFQYVRAWRVLDIACQRYQCEDKFTIEQLIDAMQHGEQVIAEVEHAPGDGENRRRDAKPRKGSKKAAKLTRILPLTARTPA